MANGNKKADKNAVLAEAYGAGASKVAAAAVPSWEVEDGKLTKLTRKDFPKTREGRVAFADYQVAVAQHRAEAVRARGDRTTQTIARIKAQIAKLEQRKDALLTQLKALVGG